MCYSEHANSVYRLILYIGPVHSQFFKDLKFFDKAEVFIQVSKLEVKIKDLKELKQSLKNPLSQEGIKELEDVFEILGYGTNLMQARYAHAAGIVTDEVTDEHFVVVTGGIDSSYDLLESSEILQDREWVQGTINILLSF